MFWSRGRTVGTGDGAWVHRYAKSKPLFPSRPIVYLSRPIRAVLPHPVEGEKLPHPFRSIAAIPKPVPDSAHTEQTYPVQHRFGLCCQTRITGRQTRNTAIYIGTRKSALARHLQTQGTCAFSYSPAASHTLARGCGPAFQVLS